MGLRLFMIFVILQEKKKKDKNAGSVNAWADQKKITNIKSLAEIQAEEQKQLAKVR